MGGLGGGGGGHDDDIMWLLETRNLGQCVWKLMTMCLPVFVECVREARQRRKRARAVLDIRAGERKKNRLHLTKG